MTPVCFSAICFSCFPGMDPEKHTARPSARFLGPARRQQLGPGRQAPVVAFLPQLVSSVAFCPPACFYLFSFFLLVVSWKPRPSCRTSKQSYFGFSQNSGEPLPFGLPLKTQPLAKCAEASQRRQALGVGQGGLQRRHGTAELQQHLGGDGFFLGPMCKIVLKIC